MKDDRRVCKWRSDDPKLGRWGWATFSTGATVRWCEVNVARYNALYGDKVSFVPDSTPTTPGAP